MLVDERKKFIKVIKDLYDSYSQELKENLKDIEETTQEIDNAGTTDKRENAGRDAAISKLKDLFETQRSLTMTLSNFEKIEDRDLFNEVFPTRFKKLYPYNSTGYIKPYSTIRVRIGNTEHILYIIAEGLELGDPTIIAADSRFAKLVIDREAGDEFQYSIPGGVERVTILEVY